MRELQPQVFPKVLSPSGPGHPFAGPFSKGLSCRLRVLQNVKVGNQLHRWCCSRQKLHEAAFGAQIDWAFYVSPVYTRSSNQSIYTDYWFNPNSLYVNVPSTDSCCGQLSAHSIGTMSRYSELGWGLGERGLIYLNLVYELS